MRNTPHSSQSTRELNRSDSLPHDKTLAKGIVFGGVVLAILIFFRNWRFYEDDSLITLRYCRNLLDGNGLIWNVGEKVEGYSNFLYLILVAGLGSLNVDLEIASRLVGGIAYIALIITMPLYTRSYRSTGFSLSELFPMLIVMTSCPIIIWVLGGLEAPLCALLACIGVVNVVRYLSKRNPSALITAGIFFALATMTRMDAILFLPPALFFSVRYSEKRTDLRAALILLTAFTSIYLPYFLWRYWYYSELLPNTFYAKGTEVTPASLIEGARYVLTALILPPSLGLWILGTLLFTRKAAFTSARFNYLMLSAASYCIFPIYAGGDHMTANRFIVPLIPVLALALYEALMVAATLPKFKHRRSLSVLLLIACTAQWSSEKLNPLIADSAEYLGRSIGEYIEKSWPPGSLVALNAAGVIPYIAKDIKFIDMLGLNDKQIARRTTPDYDLLKTKVPGHHKGDGAYVLRRKPDFIIMGPPEGTTIDLPWYASDYEMSQQREIFNQMYRKEEVDLDLHLRPEHYLYVAAANGKLHFVYYRRVEDNAAPSSK